METASEILRKPYHRWMIYDASGDGAPAWVAGVEELPGCLSQGDTPTEADEMIREAMKDWIEVALEKGFAIPEPWTDHDYSGRLMLRIPSGLHGALDAGARREGVSLNGYLSALLAGAVNWSPSSAQARARRVAAPSRAAARRARPTAVLG